MTSFEELGQRFNSCLLLRLWIQKLESVLEFPLEYSYHAELGLLAAF